MDHKMLTFLFRHSSNLRLILAKAFLLKGILKLYLGGVCLYFPFGVI